MNEQLISFELAQLANQKGFNYVKANCFGDNMAYQLPEGNLIYSHNGSTISGYILAPTQSLLQKWIFETYGFYISLGFDSWNTEKFGYTVNQKGNPEYHYDSDVDIEFDSHEEALENAMVFILKSID